jgi:hypothetical protein
MKYFGKSTKEKGPHAKCERAVKRFTGALPVQLEGELELPGVVSGSRLAGKATGADGRIAELINCRNVGAVEHVKAVSDQVKLQAFAERNALGEPQVDLEEARPDECVAT